MTKTPKDDKKVKEKPFRLFISDENKEAEVANAEKSQRPTPEPSLKTIGLTECSVCGTDCSVVLTRSGHPFTACGKCGARTFYNSRIAIDILKRRTRDIENA